MNKIIKKIQNKIMEMDMSNYNWGEGVALWGFNRSLKVCPNEEYIPFLKKWVKEGWEDNTFIPTVNTSIPCIGIGEVYKTTKNKKYLEIIKNQADFLLNEAPRLDNGAIIHSDPNVGLFGRQMWADTVFMAGLFLAYMGELTGNKKYTMEANNQLKLHMSVLQDSDGMLYHAWDENKNDHIGCKWGRANAWLSVAIVEMADYMPPTEDMINALKKQLDGIRKYQAENGLWRTVLDGTFSYYEASSAYGFGYAILKGIRLGLIDNSYLDMVNKMKKTLVDNVSEDGTVMNISAGTPVMRNEAEYNIICEHRIQTWGQGLAAMYFSEIDALGADD